MITTCFLVVQQPAIIHAKIDYRQIDKSTIEQDNTKSYVTLVHNFVLLPSGEKATFYMRNIREEDRNKDNVKWYYVFKVPEIQLSKKPH